MITGIIPAAGDSRRMGAWKPMLPVDGIPMISRAVNALLPLSIPVIVVTGYRGDELEAYLRGSFPEVACIRNRAYHEGMLTSVKTGLSCLDEESDALILPADLPLISSKHILPLLDIWKHSSAEVLRPRSKEQPGHPVILSSAAVQYSLNTSGPESMQELLVPLSHEFAELSDQAYYLDADTPEEYRKLTL